MFRRTCTYGLAWILAGLAFTIPSTSDGAIRAFSQEEMCTLSNLIVIGTVEDRNPQWLDESTTILTTVTLSVDHVIAGNPGNTVKVRTLGGKIGDTVQHVGDEPAMPIGSKYLLLMNKATTASKPLLIGGIYGARRLDPEAELPTEQEMINLWQGVCSAYL